LNITKRKISLILTVRMRLGRSKRRNARAGLSALAKRISRKRRVYRIIDALTALYNGRHSFDFYPVLWIRIRIKLTGRIPEQIRIRIKVITWIRSRIWPLFQGWALEARIRIRISITVKGRFRIRILRLVKGKIRICIKWKLGSGYASKRK
jgi:hypothetical protein